MRFVTRTMATLALAGIGLGAAQAQAQQLIIPPSVNSQVYQSSSFVWDGFYIGGQASLIGIKSHEANPGLPPPEQLLGDIGGSAGVFAGYRYQLTDWFVLGIDAEVNNVATQFEFSGANYGALKWDAAVRATLGYPVAPNVLAYGTVGYSWGRFDMSPFTGTADSTFTAGGWQLGVGVDMMVTDNVMARINATWTHYGVNSWNSGGVAYGTSEPSNVVVRTGLAWKF